MMTGIERYTRKTRRALFLEEMEQVVPWRELRVYCASRMTRDFLIWITAP
jgi:hypothetical protein